MVWSNTIPTYISQLHRLQNKALRTVSGSSWNKTATPLYKALKILPLPLLLHFSTAKFVYNHNKLRLPQQFDNYSCNISNTQLIIPLFKTQRSLKYIGTKFWNSVHEYLRNYSFPTFKIKFKIFLLYDVD